MRMAEEHLYFILVHDRWARLENWKHIMPVYFGELPGILRPMITGSLRKRAIAGLNWIGIGRYSDDMLVERLQADLAAISQTLGDKDYLFGDRACFADAAIVAQLAAMAGSPAQTIISKTVLAEPAIMAWIERFRAANYPEMPQPAA